MRKSTSPPGSVLEGKVSLVTGATEGIGLAIAGALAEEGASLFVCARNPRRLRSLTEELSENGVRVIAVSADVGKPKSVRDLMRSVKRRFGRLDILVNNAGIAHPFRPVAELTLAEWNRVIATNLTGMFLVTRASLPLMPPGSTIVNVLSVSSRRAFPNLAAYNASKFGALGFTNTLRDELRPQRIRVIALLPGATDTAIWNTLWPQAPRAKMISPRSVARALVDALKLPPGTTAEEISLMPTSGAL